MSKKTSAQVFVESLERLMRKSPGLGTNAALARACIPPTTHSHIKRMREGEAEPTLSMLDRVAAAFGVNPYDMLIDSAEVREAVVKKAFSNWNDEIEDQIPAPKKEAARRRKKDPRGESPEH